MMKDKLTVLLPSGKDWNEVLFSQKILPIASEQVINFISTLSQSILRRPDFRVYPELMAMGFWMRKSHIIKIIDDNFNNSIQEVRLARGVIFHIAPSNVDSVFIYSWFLSMLAGNINIIRLSSKRGEQINLLLELLNDLFKLPEFSDIASRQVLISYGHDNHLTAYFSEQCDMRVIWGGDNTIRKIRQIPIPPTATELPFTDKFSLSLIGASEFIELPRDEKSKLINSFINDAFWFGQMACSSPRLIVWLGEDDIVEKAKLLFWTQVNKVLTNNMADISTADIVNKLVASNRMAIEGQVSIIKSDNNLINRIQLSSCDGINTSLHCGGGLFYEVSIFELDELLTCVSRKIQTVGYFGIPKEHLKQFVKRCLPLGIDRFVPIGKALEFSPIWDGYTLLKDFTRVVDIQN